MWSLVGSQAAVQQICCFGPGSCMAGWSPALGLSHGALGFAALGLWVGQLASAPSAHPPQVSGVGSQPGFQVWAPTPLIWVRATGLQVSGRGLLIPRSQSRG